MTATGDSKPPAPGPASEALDAAQDAARLTAIVLGADDAIISKNLDGVITSWNPAAETMFGYSAAEAIGHPIALIIPEDRLHEEAEILGRLRRGERTEHLETERLHRDGHLVPLSLNISPVRDASGRVIGASKIARDITDRRVAQHQLEATVRSLEALHTLADRVGQARSHADVCGAAIDAIVSAFGTERASVLVFDAQGVMRFIAWRGLSDHYRGMVAGHSPWTRGDRDPTPILVEDVLADPSMDVLRDEIVREGIRALAFIPLTFQGRLLGKFMVYFDRVYRLSPDAIRLAETIARQVSFGIARVDAEAAAEEALARETIARQEADGARSFAERASQTKDEFLAMLSHELRNPLGVVVHAVQILADPRASPDDITRCVSMIERQSKHLACLIDDLLDVAGITDGRIELAPQALDLRAVVVATLEGQRVQLDAKKQSTRLSLCPEPVVVLADAVRMRQVVSNLVHNASKYSHPATAIEISVEARAGEGVIRVRDEGVGIATDELDAIFDLFVQANPTLDRSAGGLGIGLTVVKRIVELQGGRVLGRSDGLGRGAEFEIALPLAEIDTGGPNVTTPLLSGSLASRRVLVVEDNSDARTAMVTLLGLQGCEAFGAAMASEALSLSAERHPDVAFVDIGLPDMDGYALALALRANLGESVLLVALSGYGQIADRERSEAAGFAAHLVKPVQLEQIAQVLGRSTAPSAS